VGKRQDAAQVAKRTAIPAAEFFYEYLEDRYGCHEVAMCVAHSILKVTLATLEARFASRSAGVTADDDCVPTGS
jgi:hypothetical protein